MRTIITILLLIFCGQILAQDNNFREEIYLHTSENDLITGETVYFSAYCYSQKTGKLSKLSKLLYVELLNDKGGAVLQAKIPLKNGRGEGSFFVGSNLNTGTYHLVAYTRWMRNFDEYFDTPVTIINPYNQPADSLFVKPKLTASIHPENGVLIENSENSILVALRNFNGQNIKGKIIDNQQNKVSDLEFDANGFAQFKLFCKSEQTYKLVLDNGKDFQFFDFPKSAENKIQFTVNQDIKNINLQIKSSQKIVNGKFEIYSKQNLVKSVNVGSDDTKFEFLKADLPQNLLRFQLKIEDKIQAERLIWNGKITEKKDTNLAKSIASGKHIFKVDIPKNATVSVSIKRHYGNLKPQTFLESKNWLSGVYSDLEISQMNIFDDKLLNSILLASKPKKEIQKTEFVPYLPEFQKGILQGKITNWNPKTDKLAWVGLAFMGDNYEVNVSQIDKNGNFYIEYAPEFTNEKPYILAENETYFDRIKLVNEFGKSFSNLQKTALLLDSVRVAEVAKRSLSNQIQNAYYKSVKAKKANRKYPKIEGIKSYSLAKFTQFPTMRDTFIEYVPEVNVNKNLSNYEIKIRTRNERKTRPPLFLLDGVITTSETLLKIPVQAVERIDVLGSRYFLGGVLFDGILSVITSQKDAGGTYADKTKIGLKTIQRPKNEVINGQISESTIPNYSDLLFWKSNIYSTENQLEIPFFTSEIKGEYLLRIEGITDEGQPISKAHLFEVK